MNIKLKNTKITKITTFEVINYSFMILVSIIMLYPFVNVFAVSLSSFSEYIKNPLMIIPKKIDLIAYKQILEHPTLV